MDDAWFAYKGNIIKVKKKKTEALRIGSDKWQICN